VANLQKGDRVEWNTSQGRTHGEIERVVTRTIMIDGTKLKGGVNEPVYVVRSEKTGKRAGHKAGALRKI
jgi:hypothetical protein